MITPKDFSSSSILLLFVSEKTLNCVVYDFRNNELVILATGDPKKWQGSDKESFKSAAKSCIDGCLEQLRGKVSKIIFAITPFWTLSSEKIVEGKTDFLREICRHYDLTTEGFIIDDEAISFYYKAEDEVNPSFISIFCGEDELRISLVHLGKIRGRLKLESPAGIGPGQIRQGLTQLEFDGVFPPKIILWGDVPENLETQMMNYPWVEEEGSIFLHLPEVDVLDWTESFLIFSKIIAQKLSATLSPLGPVTSKAMPVVLENPLEGKEADKDFANDLVLGNEKMLPEIDSKTASREKHANEEKESDDNLTKGLPFGFTSEDISSNTSKHNIHSSSDDKDDTQKIFLVEEKVNTGVLEGNKDDEINLKNGGKPVEVPGRSTFFEKILLKFRTTKSLEESTAARSATDLAGSESDELDISHKKPEGIFEKKRKNLFSFMSKFRKRPTRDKMDAVQRTDVVGISKQKPSLSSPEISRKRRVKKTIFLLLFLVPLVFSSAVAAFCFLASKTLISLFVTSQQIDQKVEVELREGVSVDIENKIIPVQQIVARVEDSQAGEVSGEKLIGEKATGKVTIFNRTSKEKAIRSGTSIIGPGNLEYLIKEESKIASKTPDLVSGVDRWGEVELDVTAVEIGSRYNLAKDSAFILKGESPESFLVKNKQDFSGGTSRQITAVSQKDINRLEEALKDKLVKKSEDELMKKVASGQRIIKETLTSKVVSFSTDKKVGDESDTVEAGLVVESSALLLLEKDINEFGEKLLVNKIPDGYELQKDSFVVSFTPQKTKDNSWVGELKVQGKTFPQVDKQSLANALMGKNKKTAVSEIKKISRVYRYTIETKPDFVSPWPFFPLVVDNIIISVHE